MSDACTFDAIVIGAGPAGSTAAREIALAGWKVALLEKSATPGASNVCGGMLSMENIRHHDVPPEVIEKTMTMELHRFPWGTVENSTTQVTVLRRNLDRFLAERAASSGATLRTGVRALCISRRADGCIAVEIRADKNPADRHTLVSRGLVLADGPHSLAQTLGLGFEPHPADTAFALAYELAWPDNPMQHYEIYYGPEIARWGFAWVFPKRDHLNVGLGCLVEELRNGRDLKGDLSAFIQGHPIAAKILSDKPVVRRRGGFIPMREARYMYGPGVLISGDAAGVVNPLFGSGIDNALLTGELAGRVMGQALERNDLSAEFLARYQREWESTKAHRFIIFQDRLTRLCRPFARLDGNLLGKLLQIGFLGGSLSWSQKLHVLLYPFLGGLEPERSCRVDNS